MSFDPGLLFAKLVASAQGGQMSSDYLRSYVLRKYSVEVGAWSYGGCFAKDFNWGGRASVAIGRYCSFGGGCAYFGVNHNIEGALLTPWGYNPKFTGSQETDVVRRHLVVGNDVWVGNGALIVSGCSRIGNGAVIGAGSVVTHDVAPYTVVAGNPARVLRTRFDAPVIDALESSAWWELEPSDLKQFVSLVKDPMAFAETVVRWRTGGA